jgi:GntR family transcriptional regulator
MTSPLIRDPVYLQLNRLLRERLRPDRVRVGDRFLTERQVSEQFGVSRATANKALANLVAEGVLEFKKGVGTFVREPLLDYDLRALVSFTDKARAAGKKPSTQLLAFQKVQGRAAGEDVLGLLHAEPDSELFWLERLRLADATPVILERRYIVAKYCPALTPAQAKGSLYALWTQRYRLVISGADETIRAVTVARPEAERLRMAPQAAGLLVTSVGYLGGGEPLWWEETLYRGDAYEFQNRLGPIQTGRPATGVLRTPGTSGPERSKK